MSELTIVTAFFDIGRGGWKSYTRKSDEYVEYFRRWARINNFLIVYTSEEIGQKVLEIRRQFHLEDRTKIVVIEDVFQCDREIYQKIKTVMENEVSRNFHKYLDRPETNNPVYNYIMLLKSYFLADAVQKGWTKSQVAWLDFGFDHGGDSFIDPLEFDFLWKYDFSDKIHCFSSGKMDDIPIFEIVRNMDVYIHGNVIIASAHLWPVLWDLLRNAMVCLTACGLADDDQTLLLMAYRERSDLFEIHHVEDWSLPLKQFGGEHLTVQYRKKKSKLSLFWRDVKKKFKYKFHKSL